MKARRFATVADYVRSVAPSIWPELIESSCIDDIATVMTPFPAAISAHSGFECRLGSVDPVADYTVMLSAADGGRDIVGGRHPDIAMPGHVHEDPAWAPVMAFLQRWAHPESPFHHRFDHICLEFDISGDPARRAVPSIFFSPRDAGRLGSAAGLDEGEAQAARSLIAEAVEILAGGPLDDVDAVLLQRSMERLPAGAFMFNVGVMCARRPAPVRILLSHISPDDLIRYLQDLDWAGDLDGLRHEIDDLAPHVDGLTYGLEIHHGIRAGVGIECYIRDGESGTERDRWPIFIDYLIERGLCLPVKGAALLAYQGVSQEAIAADTWPANLTAATAFFRGNVVPVMARTIHHVKIGFVDGAVVEAKGYFGLSLNWVQRG